MVKAKVETQTIGEVLKSLSEPIEKEFIKQREGWRDRNGNVKYVDYVEWHHVADILDKKAPSWTHTVKDIRQVGELIAVTAVINILGVTREGIGTGAAGSELGIKKAEHDALKRAAVKFGIARELYKDGFEGNSQPPSNTPQAQKRYDAKTGQQNRNTGSQNGGNQPISYRAERMSDLVTVKQLGMIRAISREQGLDPDAESVAYCKYKTDELSKKGASDLIRHLQAIEKGEEKAKSTELDYDDNEPSFDPSDAITESQANAILRLCENTGADPDDEVSFQTNGRTIVITAMTGKEAAALITRLQSM